MSTGIIDYYSIQLLVRITMPHEDSSSFIIEMVEVVSVVRYMTEIPMLMEMKTLLLFCTCHRLKLFVNNNLKTLV